MKGSTKSRRTKPGRLVPATAKAIKEKTVSIPVSITRTHQDDISWGAYVQLEPVKKGELKPLGKDDLDKIYLLEISWKGSKLKTPNKVKPVIKGDTNVLQFLLAAPGYEGSQVLIRLRFSPSVSFKEQVSAMAWRLSDMQPQKGAIEVVDFVPGAPHDP